MNEAHLTEKILRWPWDFSKNLSGGDQDASVSYEERLTSRSQSKTETIRFNHSRIFRGPIPALTKPIFGLSAAECKERKIEPSSRSSKILATSSSPRPSFVPMEEKSDEPMSMTWEKSAGCTVWADKRQSHHCFPISKKGCHVVKNGASSVPRI